MQNIENDSKSYKKISNSRNGCLKILQLYLRVSQMDKLRKQILKDGMGLKDDMIHDVQLHQHKCHGHTQCMESRASQLAPRLIP